MEKSRYNAEANPQGFIKQYDTVTQKSASDFYLLGTAYLKQKNYEEAKKNFILARNNLRAENDPEKRVVLDAEITQGLAISQDAAAQAAYDRAAKQSPLV